MPWYKKYKGYWFDKSFEKFDLNVSVFDHVNKGKSRKFNINILGNIPKNKKFKGVIMAVAHEQFKNLKMSNGEVYWKEGIFLTLKILFLISTNKDLIS